MGKGDVLRIFTEACCYKQSHKAHGRHCLVFLSVDARSSKQPMVRETTLELFEEFVEPKDWQCYNSHRYYDKMEE